jgi:hypothetical protein
MRELLSKLQHGKITLKDFKEKFYDEWNNWRRRPIHSDVIMYSLRMNKHNHINNHEFKRLRFSIMSIRKFNWDIEIFLFCDYPDQVPPNFKEDFHVQVIKSHDYDRNILNAWSIHRWFNLQHFKNRSVNILYVDSDTIFYQDPKYLFETYSHYDVYGKEEKGFRHCPMSGSEKDIRFKLDLVDACIQMENGKTPIHKFCIGAILMNNNIHWEIVNRLNELKDILNDLKANKLLNPIPNPRILDQYAMWILWSRMSASNGLFGVQDVTHGWLEQKHEEYFNPVLLHYTTRDEQKFVEANKEYSSLRRDTEELSVEIDPHSTV